MYSFKNLHYFWQIRHSLAHQQVADISKFLQIRPSAKLSGWSWWAPIIIVTYKNNNIFALRKMSHLRKSPLEEIGLKPETSVNSQDSWIHESLGSMPQKSIPYLSGCPWRLEGEEFKKHSPVSLKKDILGAIHKSWVPTMNLSGGQFVGPCFQKWNKNF